MQPDLNDGEAYNKRGIAYRRKGQYDQAISDHNKALETLTVNTAERLALNSSAHSPSIRLEEHALSLRCTTCT